MTTPETEEIKQRIVDAIKTVYDPEIPINVYDLGLIYDIAIDDTGHVKLVMTLTSPNCPVAEALPQSVQQKVRSVDGVADVQLELTWEPAWTPERMSDDAKLALDYEGGPVRKDPFTSLSIGKSNRPR
jgi:FeS assembly SUF system protein